MPDQFEPGKWPFELNMKEIIDFFPIRDRTVILIHNSNQSTLVFTHFTMSDGYGCRASSIFKFINVRKLQKNH